MRKPAPDNAVVSSGYGARAPINTPAGWTASFHHGIDYKVNGPDGRGVAFPVTAAADGVVIPTRFSVQSVGAAGVTLHHKDGTSTFYGHMRFKTVNVGDQVKAGEVIGVAGREGFATGIHLHFELLRNPPGSRGWLERSNRINPAGSLSSRPAPKPEAPDGVPFPLPKGKPAMYLMKDDNTGNVFLATDNGSVLVKNTAHLELLQRLLNGGAGVSVFNNPEIGIINSYLLQGRSGAVQAGSPVDTKRLAEDLAKSLPKANAEALATEILAQIKKKL